MDFELFRLSCAHGLVRELSFRYFTYLAEGREQEAVRVSAPPKALVVI